ncbi:CCA tRNA nucleotidyltransferase [Paracoccus sediminicola]|uniref:CCA tRNA nucleotidyltransferase n=1 Tax=Paracoccus sediminicola TaxID=3017783 RepID=UPI0022F00547|nr:CCA tRNA nucleotidyltransferase [Paracoccus sediminicola]WBU56719.1 CCA tRNA nucleotidyltransferase [Paracoccus sediminicola]
MKIDGDFLRSNGLQGVMQMLSRGGHHALIVGGAVRNAALGLPVGDVDIATDARPERVIELSRTAGFKPVPTGVDHGTVTVVAHGMAFEVTTFRRDVETDGRRAVVAFSREVAEDAARRDFTMNALYADAEGQVLDPVGGWEDLHRRELRFVGDPAARIREDYLRVLRFFRFVAWYADRSAPGTTEAIAANRDGLSRVSAERIGAELRKLLAAPDPSDAVTLMVETGVMAQILPNAAAQGVAGLIAAERAVGVCPDWRRRLAALRAGDCTDRLRLSRAESAYLGRLAAAEGDPLDEIAYRHGAEIARDTALIRIGRGDAPPPGWAERIANAATARLPISARDLMPALSGAAIGRGLAAAEQLWIDSGFAAPKPALLDAAYLAAGDDT